ncbi:unnamed protein product [Bursaphelenchus xylophilus]|uniref:(pine wood nematode) hypothetical protein n=1 Tax=Bursaphelenchus xylophilus TaxID=6326 RepID=A0A1I7SA29_BURXY|nr:unnamed protein product [Bursaphelenchus xylophilus]CAG9131780.1 unnamed protein product [Bursaphelenchus xylophilus]
MLIGVFPVFFCLSFTLATNDIGFEIYGMRMESRDYKTTDFIMNSENGPVQFLLFLDDVTRIDQVGFVQLSEECNYGDKRQFLAEIVERKEESHQIKFSVSLEPSDLPYKLCMSFVDDNQSFVLPLDEFRVLQHETNGLYFPLWLQLTCIGLLLPFSGYFSGITISTFSLSTYHLRLLSSCGDEKKATYARNILPLRERANRLLTTLVLGNVIVNNLLTLLIDNVLDYYVQDSELKYAFSVPITIFVIMIFGEILPQAIGMRWCLEIVSGTRSLTIFFVVLFYPIAWPISKILDLLVGETGRNTYNCEELKALVEHHHGRQEDQAISKKLVELVVGAYRLPENKIRDVMTPLDKVYMLDENTLMTREVCAEIHKKGHTRIPLYQNGNKNMVTCILNVKDLAAFLPNCGIRLGFIAKMFHRNLQIRFVLEEMNLMKLLRLMKRGHPMVFVMRFDSEQKDYEIAGVITVEDIVEEIIGEINDEKDARRRGEQIVRMPKDEKVKLREEKKTKSSKE